MVKFRMIPRHIYQNQFSKLRVKSFQMKKVGSLFVSFATTENDDQLVRVVNKGREIIYIKEVY